VKRALTLFGAVCAICVGSASAEPLRNFKIGDWFAGSYSFSGTNQFSHCAAVGTYRSGITMIFAIDKKFAWSVGFANDQWRLNQGAKYDVVFKIDDYPPLTGTATAISTTQVSVPMADNVQLFSLFRRGQELKVYSAGQTFVFNLTNTGKVLPALLNCVNSYVTPAPMTSASINPFDINPRTETSTANKTNKEGNNRAEATALVANVLAQAGLTNFYVFPPNEMPSEIKADVIWKTSNVVGTFTVAPSSKLDELTAALIGSDVQDCKGKFVSGSIPDETGVVRVFTACEKDKKATTIYYLGVPRKAGGLYLMATMDFGEEQAARKADESIRSAVQQVLFRPGQ